MCSTMKVLAVGDSITEGYVNGGRFFHPFTTRLELLLNQNVTRSGSTTSGSASALPVTSHSVSSSLTSLKLNEHVSEPLVTNAMVETKTKEDVTPVFEVLNYGVSGEQTDSMSKRLKGILIEHKPGSLRYATVMSGLNDVGGMKGYPPLEQEVLDNLQGMCDLLLGHGCKSVFLMTLPICPADKGVVWYHKLKLGFNQKLRDLCKKGIILVDVAKELSFLEMSAPEQKRLWCDNLHFTAAGYDTLADVIFNIMSSVIN